MSLTSKTMQRKPEVSPLARPRTHVEPTKRFPSTADRWYGCSESPDQYEKRRSAAYAAHVTPTSSSHSLVEHDACPAIPRTPGCTWNRYSSPVGWQIEMPSVTSQSLAKRILVILLVFERKNQMLRCYADLASCTICLFTSSYYNLVGLQVEVIGPTNAQAYVVYLQITIGITDYILRLRITTLRLQITITDYDYRLRLRIAIAITNYDNRLELNYSTYLFYFKIYLITAWRELNSKNISCII